MALPPQRTFLLPILEIAAQAEHRLEYKDFLEALKSLLLLGDADLQERTPSGSIAG